MGVVESVIVAVAVLVFVGVTVYFVVSKLKGKTTCCSDCSSCPHAKQCHTAKDEKSHAECKGDCKACSGCASCKHQ